MLELPHQGMAFAMFLFQIVNLAHADTVLAGAGALHRQRPIHQTLIEGLGFFGLGPVVGANRDHQMKIAIADMPEHRDRHRGARDVLGGLQHAFGQARDRHADIGGDGATAGA